MSYNKKIALIIAPAISLFMVLFVDLKPGQPQITATAAIALWMAIWWISESVPLAVTALLPTVLFPALGVMSGKDVSTAYINHIIFLFIGGFLVAMAIQQWGLHKRIALRILILFGRGPGRILLGFMLTTGFLSMWISNTATSMMMVPVVLAIIINIEEQLGAEKSRHLAIGFLLAIAFSASIGGMASLIGTPPNLSFARILQISFSEAPEISFANWMFFALPISILMMALCWTLIYIMFIRRTGIYDFASIGLNKQFFENQFLALGPASREQKQVFIAFISMALLWIFRNDIKLGSLIIPGWSRFFPHSEFLNDGTVAIAIAIILFLLPSQTKQKRLLDVNVFGKLPWHIILLFGGGFALAGGFINSGLSAYIAEQISGLGTIHPLILIFSICLLITFLTELTSNTATTEMFLPVLAAMAVAFEVNPLMLMLPATISASFAFMLPVATPPNAIVFGTNRLHVYDMARAGIGLNLIGAILISIAVYYWAPLVFSFSLDILPDWAVLNSAKH